MTTPPESRRTKTAHGASGEMTKDRVRQPVELVSDQGRDKWEIDRA